MLFNSDNLKKMEPAGSLIKGEAYWRNNHQSDFSLRLSNKGGEEKQHSIMHKQTLILAAFIGIGKLVNK